VINRPSTGGARAERFWKKSIETVSRTPVFAPEKLYLILQEVVIRVRKTNSAV
jgi:hypothetical protein